MPVKSKTQTYNRRSGRDARVGSRRTAKRPGQSREKQLAPGTSVSRTPLEIEDTSPERLTTSTNKKNPM